MGATFVTARHPVASTGTVFLMCDEREQYHHTVIFETPVATIGIGLIMDPDTEGSAAT